MKVAILTDSASNLSKEFIKKHTNLYVIPLMILVDEVSYRDQVEISVKEVYEKLDTNHLSTSLPASGDVLDAIEDIKAKGFTDIIAINLSSGLSGTFNSFRLLFNDVKGINIVHYDSKTLGGGLGVIVEYALELVAKKTPINQFVPLLEKLRYEDSIAIYTINTLKYLKKGGRIGKVEGTIGDILHIKPVITVNDEGVYVTLSKAFGLSRSLISMKNILEAKFGKDLIDVIVHYGDNLEMAKQLGEKLQTILNIRNLTMSELTPVLGIHTGPSMFAYIARRIK